MGTWYADGYRCSGRAMSDIDGILLYTFTSCYNKIDRGVSITQDKIAVQKDADTYMFWRLLGRVHFRNIW
jgi:hypothetical protein